MNPLIGLALALAVAVVAVSAVIGLVIRSPEARAALPKWPARDWRAMVALIASVGGAAVLTWFAWWLVAVLSGQADRLISKLVRDPHVRNEVGAVLVVIIRTLAWGVKLLLAGIIAVLLSLGLAINRRSISLGRSGLNLSGGDDGDPPPVPVQVVNPPEDPANVQEAKP